MDRRKLLAKCLIEKACWRKKLADLPILEKVKSLIRMQKAANEIRKAMGRPLKMVWAENK